MQSTRVYAIKSPVLGTPTNQPTNLSKGDSRHFEAMEKLLGIPSNVSPRIQYQRMTSSGYRPPC